MDDTEVRKWTGRQRVLICTSLRKIYIEETFRNQSSNYIREISATLTQENVGKCFERTGDWWGLPNARSRCVLKHNHAPSHARVSLTLHYNNTNTTIQRSVFTQNWASSIKKCPTKELYNDKYRSRQVFVNVCNSRRSKKLHPCCFSLSSIASLSVG